MDIDDVLAGLSPADREALLQRLLEEQHVDDESVDSRLRRLEELVGSGQGLGARAGRRSGRRQGFGGETAPWARHNHHCHCCG